MLKAAIKERDQLVSEISGHAHFIQCRELTAYGARLATNLVLRERLELVSSSAEKPGLKKSIFFRGIVGVITGFFRLGTKSRQPLTSTYSFIDSSRKRR